MIGLGITKNNTDDIFINNFLLIYFLLYNTIKNIAKDGKLQL